MRSIVDEARRQASATQKRNRDEGGDWREWLKQRFPHYRHFAPRHERLWNWFASLRDGVPQRAAIECWGRGGGKSNTAELGCAYVGERLSRRFVLYISGTQGQADDRLAAIAKNLEQLGITRSLNKYGFSKGWTGQLLRTSTGFNVMSVGLDSAARGIKLDEFRPDLQIFDDVDARHESPRAVGKKIETITQSLLPAASPDCAILFLQNLIHRDSIMSQLIDGRADFLLDREVAKPEPAVNGLQYEREIQENGLPRYRITGGTPTWEGQNLTTCENQMNNWGRLAFLREAQHQVKDAEKGLWKLARDIAPFRVAKHPPLVRVAVAVDPSASKDGNECGIMVGGVDAAGHGYLLEDCTVQGTPREWAKASVGAFHRHEADALVAEANQGGAMVETTIQTVEGAPPVHLVHASRGKIPRAEPVQKLCEDGMIHHVGNEFSALEDQQVGWEPGDDSPDRMDAYVWLWTFLMLDNQHSVVW